MGAKVLFRDSNGRDGSVDLAPDIPCYVGRAMDCAIRTDDAMVSRKHSMIRMEGGAFFVEDLGSSNGTIVNNQRVSKQKLNHNDVVRCGSLWLRYIEDGPIMGAAAAQPRPAQPAYGGYGQQGGGQPVGGYGGGQPVGGYGMPQSHGAGPSMNPLPKRGGTRRLDVAGGAGSAQPASSSPMQYSPQPSIGASPYGSPPALPSDGGVLYGGPPPLPSDAGSPYGAPPPLPSDPVNPFGPPSIPEGMSSGVVGGNPFDRPNVEQSVVVDMGPSESTDKVNKELSEVRAKLEQLQSTYDREVADGKRMRAEAATLRDRIEELRDTIKDRDEQVQAHNRVAEELRQELNQTKGDLAGARVELAELSDDMQAKERQMSRSQEDINKLKDDIEENSRQLAEVSKTKDEGWKKLNEQLSEIEHLREVINEQERMLEERRVGLISQEEVIKQLRAEKERQIKAFAQIKAECDELVGNQSRYAAQLQTIDEENKRLSRMLSETQKGGGIGGEHTATLAEELKNTRIEARKLESDRDRFREMHERAEATVQRLDDRVAQLEVELREANDKRTTATSSQSIIEESLAKAEVARAKAAEEALDAAKARDEANAAAEAARRESERLRRRLEALDKAGTVQGGDDSGEIRAENDGLKRKLRLAQDQASDLERTVGSLKAELDAALADAKAARAAADAAQARASHSGGSTGKSSGAADNDLTTAIREKASDVYDSINDILSEIRNNVKLVQDEFGTTAGGSSEDSVRIISDTIQTLIDSAEDAKGVLRGLREVVELT